MNTKTEGLAEQLARLARIELSDSELERTQTQLGSILNYIESLESLDLSAVPERLEGDVKLAPLRPDRARSPFDPERLLSAAPDRRGDLVSVPKVKGEG